MVRYNMVRYNMVRYNMVHYNMVHIITWSVITWFIISMVFTYTSMASIAHTSYELYTIIITLFWYNTDITLNYTMNPKTCFIMRFQC